MRRKNRKLSVRRDTLRVLATTELLHLGGGDGGGGSGERGCTLSAAAAAATTAAIEATCVVG